MAMKKIINGKMYNTETAKLLHERVVYYNGNYDGGCCFYRKKTGEFFVWAYGVGLDEGRIQPYTEEEAKSYVERFMTADEYIAIFGEVEE